MLPTYPFCHHQLLYLTIPRKNLGTDQVKEHPWVSEVKIWGGLGGWGMVRLQAPWFCKKLPNYPKVLPRKWKGELEAESQ